MYQDDQIMEGEMGSACRMHREMKNVCKILLESLKEDTIQKT